MCNEMMSRYHIQEKRQTFDIILNYINLNRKSISYPGDNTLEQKTIETNTSRITKNYSFSSSKNSLQRESRQSNEGFTTEELIDYPTAVSAQSSNKIKHKKSLPLEPGPNNSNGFLIYQNTNTSQSSA